METETKVDFLVIMLLVVVFVVFSFVLTPLGAVLVTVLATIGAALIKHQ